MLNIYSKNIFFLKCFFFTFIKYYTWSLSTYLLGCDIFNILKYNDSSVIYPSRSVNYEGESKVLQYFGC